MTDRKDQARKALQTWAAKTRSQLVADCWRAGEHNIRELARLAQVDRSTIYTDLETQHIDWRSDRRKDET